MKVTRVGLGILSLALALVAVALPNVAFSTESVDAMDEDVLADQLLIAAKNGWSLEETRAHEHSADILMETTRQVVEQHSDVFVGSAVGLTPYAPPTIFIKGAVDDYVRSIITSAEIEITIMDGQPYSYMELRERRNTVHGRLLAAGYTHVLTRTDITNRGAVSVTIGKERAGLPSAMEVLDGLPAALRHDIDLRFVDATMLTLENSAFGGMWATNSGANWCTTGWAVQNISSGVTGVTTAGHCLDVGEVDGVRHPGYGIHPASFKFRVLHPAGDAGWMTTNEPEPPKYYAATNDTRWVESTATFPADYPLFHEICVFGRASAAAGQGDHGRECATLIDPEANCGPQYLAMMYPDVTQGGDSGAPWSRYKKAFGSHVGSCVDGQDSVFMRVDLFPATLNVFVRLH